MLALLLLADRAAPQTVDLPIGIPGTGTALLFDERSLCALPPLLFAGAAILMFPVLGERGTGQRAGRAPLAAGGLRLLGLSLSILAADWVTLAASTAIAVFSGAGSSVTGGHSGAGSSVTGGPMAMARRAAGPMAGLVAVVVIVLLIRGAFPGGSVLASAAFGVVLVAGGALGALACGWTAARTLDLRLAVAAMGWQFAGLAAVALGLAVLASSADLPGVAGLGLMGGVMAAVTIAAAGTLGSLAAVAVRRQAGLGRIDHLGGLIHAMPVTSMALLAAMLAMTPLPLTPGFACFWLLYQTILAMPVSHPLTIVPVTVAFAVLGGAVAVSGALTLAAAARQCGIALLGGPRGPRAAGVEEIPRQARITLLALASVVALTGLFPGPILRVLVDPVAHAILGTGIVPHAGWLTLSAAGPGGYQPLPLALVLAVAVWTANRLLARFAPAPGRIVPAWEDGFAPPPAWLPYGDPLTRSDPWPDVPKPPWPAWLKPWPTAAAWRPLGRRLPRASASAAIGAMLAAVAALTLAVLVTAAA